MGLQYGAPEHHMILNIFLFLPLYRQKLISGNAYAKTPISQGAQVTLEKGRKVRRVAMFLLAWVDTPW